MGSESNEVTACCFCGGGELVQTHRELFHRFERTHGPFSFFRCVSCGSGITLHPPTSDQLTTLYSSYREGLPELHRGITQDDPQNALYSQCVQRILASAGPGGKGLRSWIDVGAGGGELSRILMRELPAATGLAVDLHDRPPGLATSDRIDWKQVDLNGENFAAAIGTTSRLVIAASVWEHVLAPDRFIQNLLRLLEPGGRLYLLAPDYGSFASRVMGQHWPYFTPGEHLNLPTKAGARLCLARQWQAVHADAPPPAIYVSPQRLPYTLRYVFRRFGMHGIGRLIPTGLSIPLPVGALEAVLQHPVDWPAPCG